ncbi:hypothetical protein EBZ39_13715 [bacterium]|nr:hypothetical protein [bacterium]
MAADNVDDLAVDATGRQPQPQGPSPIKVMFDGEEREYAPEAAVNMIQQMLNMKKLDPILSAVNKLKESTGIVDNNELANFLLQNANNPEVKAAMDQVQNPPAVQPDPNAESPLVKAATQAAAKSDAEVKAQVDEFFNSNGLTPTPALETAMTNLVRWGDVLGTLGANLPAVVNDLNASKQITRAIQSNALEQAVGIAATRAVQELGIEDNEANMADFTNFVKAQDTIMPGYAQRVSADPDATYNAIKIWGATFAVKKAQREAAEQKGEVQADMARAGGDAAAGRGAGMGAGEPSDINAQMLQMPVR